MPCMRHTSFHQKEATARYLFLDHGLSLDQRAQRIRALKRENLSRREKTSSQQAKKTGSGPKGDHSACASNMREDTEHTVPFGNHVITMREHANIPKASVLYHPSCQSAHDRHDIVSMYHYIYKLRDMKGGSCLCHKQPKAMSLKPPSSSPSSPSCSSSSWPRTS